MRSSSAGTATVPPPVSPFASPDAPSLRRRAVVGLPIAAGVAGAVLDASSANAFTKTSKEEIFNVPGNERLGFRPFLFTKPNKFRQFVNVLDPQGYVFKNTNVSDVKFTISATADANASAIFTPEFFINDYNTKYSNATGSSFKLLKGDGPPAREDAALKLKYYNFEYVVTKQTDFGFDSLKTLHFYTTFIVAPDSLYILNCQSPEDKWDTYQPVLKGIVDSFTVTG